MYIKYVPTQHESIFMCILANLHSDRQRWSMYQRKKNVNYWVFWHIDSWIARACHTLECPKYTISRGRLRPPPSQLHPFASAAFEVLAGSPLQTIFGRFLWGLILNITFLSQSLPGVMFKSLKSLTTLLQSRNVWILVSKHCFEGRDMDKSFQVYRWLFLGAGVGVV